MAVRSGRVRASACRLVAAGATLLGCTSGSNAAAPVGPSQDSATIGPDAASVIAALDASVTAPLDASVTAPLDAATAPPPDASGATRMDGSVRVPDAAQASNGCQEMHFLNGIVALPQVLEDH